MEQPRHESAECALVYDGRCRLCVAAKTHLERLESGRSTAPLRLIPYDSLEARRLLREEYRPGRPDVAFLIDSAGNVTRGLDAFLPLLPALKGGSFLAGFFRLPIIKPFARQLYSLVAKYRYLVFGEVHAPTRESSYRP